jgi:bud site selection protein 31
MSKFGRKQKSLPEGWDYVESTLTALENELRDKVNEDHTGMRKVESSWPVHQINWQKSRYIYDLYYTYHRISREVYDYCIENKIVDAALIAKWKKPGYERLCSTFAINTKNSKYGTVSICRVPRSSLDGPVEDQTTGCLGCGSGPTTRNIFGNKYGQYLAQIQVAREARNAAGGDASSSGATSEKEAGNVGSDDDDGDCEDGKDHGLSVWAHDDTEAEAAVQQAFGSGPPLNVPQFHNQSAKSTASPQKRSAPKYEPPGKRKRV